ncbi:MAG TPA: SGNH/GDSL hydrolase family protein [Candidatus Binataceae bacterium]|nr:SGNH/GDSL hydrolase family protein [Candidatus Binataceae bacterium]
MLRRIAANLLLVVFGLVVGLAVAEAAVRMLGLGRPGFFVYNRATGWSLRPGASGWQSEEGRAWVAINNAGMRDREHALQKPPGTLRIAVLGDSFTEAQQVPQADTFCALLQPDLKNCPALHGRTVETLNFGCDSYGTGQELMTLRTQVWRYHPDVVVLAFCTGNDVRNDSAILEGDKCQPFFTLDDDELVPTGDFSNSAVFRAQCAARFDSQGSALLNLLGDVRSRLRARYRMWRAAASAPHPMGSELGLDDTTYSPPATPHWRDAWAVAEQEVAEINREVKGHGARFLLVTLSNGIQVYPDAAVRAAYMQRMGVANLFYPEQRLAALGQREGFEVLNLAPAMQQYADHSHTFLHGFSNTKMGFGHWNEAGHRLAAQLIAQRLCTILNEAQVKAASPAP